jgi:Flp pilus assembly protein TadG
MMPLLHRFLRNQQGASLVEFALLAPILLFLLMGTVTLFDLFRSWQSVEKATFTVGDIMSRETGALTQSKLESMLALTSKVVTSGAGGGLRVSSIGKKNGVLTVHWTRSVGNHVPATTLSLSLVPALAEGDSVLLTESFVPHAGFVNLFGFDTLVFSARAAHRPRFVSAIAWKN